MLNENSLPKTSKYMSVSDKPGEEKFTALDFTRLFFSVASSNENLRVLKRRDFVYGVHSIAQKEEYKDLVKDIGFRVSGDTIDSPDLNDALAHMNLFKYLIVKQNEIISLVRSADSIKTSSYSCGKHLLMREFVDDFSFYVEDSKKTNEVPVKNK